MAQDRTTGQRIVVGVDGSTAPARALDWALGQAEATGAVVEAVTVWNIPAGYGYGPTVIDGEDLADAAGRSLDQAVAAATEARPTVTVERAIRRGHAAAVLIEVASNAQLLVVGSHGRGGFASALLGSVNLHCTQHATCPVVVVRDQRSE